VFRITTAEDREAQADQDRKVEPAGISHELANGAMSLARSRREAHTTLAIALNRLGGKSNTGRVAKSTTASKPLPNGDSMRSAIKQVAGALRCDDGINRQLDMLPAKWRRAQARRGGQ